MPPKIKSVLTAVNNQKDVERTDDPRKKKPVKMREDKPSTTDTVLENWSDIVEKALAPKNQKTTIKVLASNVDKALEELSINELRRCLWTSSFIAVPEGQKFCTRALPKIGVKSAYYLIKKAIIDNNSTKQTWESYGELIGTAWKYYHKEDDTVCREIEDEIMKGLFHDAIMLADALSEKFMHTLISFKTTTCSLKAKMDNMLYQSARVVLWRGCEAPNNRVRYRSCKVLMGFYPWRPSDQEELGRASCYQHSNLVNMLKDPCSEIRREAAYKVLKICAQYWTYIPSYEKRLYLTIICDELILDADPSVRLAILEGMSHMVMESICLNAAESALKCVCPVTVCDKNERVRLETFKLLRKLIPNRFLKYWNIVPIEKVMRSLEVETSESIKKEIVQLVFTSFFQKDENANETLKRLNYLSKYGRQSALTFYRLILPLKLISLEDAGTHLKNIALAVYKFASGNFSDDSKLLDDTIASLGGPASENLNENHPKWTRVKLFMDCSVVLYMMLLRDKEIDENLALKGKLEKVMTKVFQKLFQCFRETSALGTTMTLGSMIPQQTLQKENLISGVLHYLNEETDNAVIKPYLEATMQWNADAVLEIISQGISVITQDVNMCSPSTKKNKNAGEEITPGRKLSKALFFLSYVISSLTAKTILINNHLLELKTIYMNMRPINNLIEERLSRDGLLQTADSQLSDDIILDTYIMKHTLICILLNATKSERQAEDCLIYVQDLCADARWFEEQILSLSDVSSRNMQNYEFFYKLSTIVLRKMCDALMSWDFSDVLPASQVNHNSSTISQITETDFIESVKRIGYAFMKETTPSDCMPSVFNAARQLFILNPDDPNLSVATVMYVPTWIIERVDNGDELEDKQIGDQLFHLLKVVSESPNFFPIRYAHQLAQTLIDAMTWIIQDSSDCPDPREHNFEVPRFIEVLLFQSIRRHAGLFKIFLDAMKERFTSRDLFIGAEAQYPDIPKEMVDMLVLGACTQLIHICYMNPDTLQEKKREIAKIDNDEKMNNTLIRLKQRVEKLEEDDTQGIIDNLLAAQVKSMLSS